MIEAGCTGCRFEWDRVDGMTGGIGYLRERQAQLAGFLQCAVGLEAHFHIADAADVAQLVNDRALLRQQEQQRDT